VTLGPETDLINTPIKECTPLYSIPRILLIISIGLGFEAELFVVGDYYYNHNTREMDKMTLKRERGKVYLSRETPERNIKGKFGPGLKDNEIQAASVLGDFADVNIVSVHKVAGELNVVKYRINELETILETIKGAMSSEYRK
jgi:hypothetical protein